MSAVMESISVALELTHPSNGRTDVAKANDACPIFLLRTFRQYFTCQLNISVICGLSQRSFARKNIFDFPPPMKWHMTQNLVTLCGNKMPTRCNGGFYCTSYCLLNMFRASLCPSSGAQEYYTVVAACGILCCGFSSSCSGVELRVMCQVCRMLQHPANRTHNPQLWA